MTGASVAVPGGVLSVLVTPFAEDGSLDLASLRRLVEHNLAWGVDALVCFGLAGELYKLTDDDRRAVLRTVVETAAGEVPVIAGTEHSGVESAVVRSVEAVEAGASALMLFPPTFVKPDADGVVDYYAAVGAATPAPVIVQDAPAWTGVPLPVDLLALVAGIAPTVGHVKVEVQPSAGKIRAVRERGLTAIGGFGALHLVEDLDAGIASTMPGCALPGLYRDLWRAHAAGRRDDLWALFAGVVPLLAHQVASLDLFVAVQKTLLERIGVLASARVRRPGVALSSAQLAWLDELLTRTPAGGYLGLADATAR